MGKKNNKRRKGEDSVEDRKAIKSGGKKKKQRRKAQRHFDKDALRGIIDGTVNVDAYQDYVDGEH
jgi:hypothetical protein